jgi:hypothetical protein
VHAVGASRAPLTNWQWHMDTTCGSPSTVMRIAQQAHVASRDAIFPSRSAVCKLRLCSGVNRRLGKDRRTPWAIGARPSSIIARSALQHRLESIDPVRLVVSAQGEKAVARPARRHGREA